MKFFWIVLFTIISNSVVFAQEVETRQANILVSINESAGKSGNSITSAWVADGQWFYPGKSLTAEFTINSNYAKSDSGETDRLKTSTRFVDIRNDTYWKPVLLIQTEGDHFGRDSLQMILAAGIHHQLKKSQNCFIEFTGGASKDLTTGEPWTGDIGMEFGYETTFDKWHFRTGPKGQMGAWGSARIRGDRFRFSWDFSLDYSLNKKVSLGYRLWLGNTLPDARRTQWLGININLK